MSKEYRQTSIQYLLNVGPASPVLDSIHLALVSTLSWQKCVYIVYTAPMLFKCWPASYIMSRYRTDVRYIDLLPGQWRACVA